MVRKKYIVQDILTAAALFIIILFLLLLSSCKHEPIELSTANNGSYNNNGVSHSSTCDPDTAYFQTQVLPILISNCAKSGCHNEEDHKEGIVLNNYSNVMATGDIDPGDPGNSEIYEVLIETDPDKRMPVPPATQLTNEQINIIYKWIAQGARNNSCSDNCDTTTVTFSGTIFPLIQNSCIGCHSGSTPGGQINLSSYQGILAVAQNGKLLGSVNHEIGFSQMPKGGNKLASCRVDQIRIWIEDGAMNN
jgi:hypothetical protein